MVIEKVEIRRVVKQHFTNLAVERLIIDIDLEIQFLGGFLHVLPELHKSAFTRKTIRLEQDLILAVMDHIVRQVLSLGMLAYVFVHKAFNSARERSLINPLISVSGRNLYQ
jgi:hypothetical protein